MATNPTVWIHQSDELRRAIEENDQALEARRQTLRTNDHTQRIWMAALAVGAMSVIAAAIGIVIII